MAGGSGDLRQTLNYDLIASEYAQHRQIHPGVLRNLCARIDISNGFRVLEVGCGTGNYILALERLTEARCWGLDPSGGMLAEAQARPGGIRFQIGGAEGLDFPAGFFNVVFSVDVIHHVGDRLAYFQEAYRVLKVGGAVCTVTDSEWIIRNRQPLAVYFPETIEVELDRYPGIDQLQDLMKQAGFDETSQELVEFRYELAEMQAYRDKAFSALHLIPEEAFQRGIERLAGDLWAGPIPCVSRYVLLWGIR
jgi:ubiquinone/menaquinone biosynthesis C-methylase UbiE